ncbi:MAG: WecB/TagA/CpsF family glycosyltransferase [Pelagimonas sp.]|uniref:WecB/TagA/CpsF family glycosyltransferase n=1 Tax=Pelagimonas sp. TaxID=2073170 RepID=UPI003D6C33AE
MEFQFDERKISVNVPNWAVLEARVTERLAQRKGFALATINLDHLVKLGASPEFRSTYAAQDFVCADGNPIVWMSHIAGRAVSLIPGSEAILPLAKIAAKQGVGVALVGSTDPVLKAAAEYLEREVRDLDVVCCIAPPMGFDCKGAEAETVIERVADSGARLCFVAMGAPRQEEFAATGRRVAPEIGFVSIGAGLDFFAGTQKRAPQWAQKLQVEWLWRMLSNPQRLAVRYLKCMAILPGHVTRAALLRVRKDQS